MSNKVKALLLMSPLTIAIIGLLGDSLLSISMAVAVIIAFITFTTAFVYGIFMLFGAFDE
jgi:hypothetical protein